jgi:predicted MPP superfamily phosphohydrolase
MFPFNLMTRAIFGKYHRGLNFEDGFSVYTSPGTGGWGPMMRTGNSPEITVFRLKPA